MSAKDFDLHVSLIVKTQNKKLADARFIAWSQGPAGLERLLSGVTHPVSDDATQKGGK